MTIVGFNFTKINAERIKAPDGKIGIQNNVEIKEVKKTDLPIGTSKQEVLVFLFEFTSKYMVDKEGSKGDKIGEILLGGEILYMDEPAKIKEIVKEWKEKKQLTQQNLMTDILNHVLAKSNIEALILTKEINLPPTIPLPKVQPGAKK